LLQLRDSLLTRLVQIAEIGLQALAALALFAAEDQLNPVCSPWRNAASSCAARLRSCAARCAPAWQSRVHLVDLLIQLWVFCVSRSLPGGGDGLFLRFKLGEQGGALLLLLAYRALFAAISA
jgi:hypothetical protein